MNYQQEKQAYDDRVKRLQNVEALDEGPDKGTPVKVQGVYTLAYDKVFRSYTTDDCLAAGPFEANFNDLIAINGQFGDYDIYLLDKELDPEQRIIIIRRDETARILKDYGVSLTFNYGTPIATRNMAAALAVLLLEDDTTVDEALTALINPQEDETKSDDDRVKRLLDEGPHKGTPVKVQGVYTLAYDKVSRAYNVDNCLSAGPFEANFYDTNAINEQFGDYTIYLLDKEIDPELRIIIIQRGETAHILTGYGLELPFKYICTPIATRNMAAALAIFVDKAKSDYDQDRVKRLQHVKVLDMGPDKGTTPVKVQGVYTLAYDKVSRAYNVDNCLSAGPFEANFYDTNAINEQFGDYTIYLLDKEIDPKQRIIIIQRGETARILDGYLRVLTFNYVGTPIATRNMAAALAVLVLEDNTTDEALTVDEALTALINPQEDEIKSDF